MRSHGPHQLALRRRSVKVFEGAMKVLMMRAPSESGAVSVAGTDAGESGAAAMFSLLRDAEGILAGRRRRHKRRWPRRHCNESKAAVTIWTGGWRAKLTSGADLWIR